MDAAEVKPGMKVFAQASYAAKAKHLYQVQALKGDRAQLLNVATGKQLTLPVGYLRAAETAMEPTGQVRTGQVLRDDDHRPVRVLAVITDAQGRKVELERLDKKPREHRKVVRWQAEVAHYPVLQDHQGTALFPGESHA